MGLVVGAVRAVPRALGRRVLRGRALEDGADRVEQRRGRADGRVEVPEGSERRQRRGGHVRAPRVARRCRARNEVLEQVEEGPDLMRVGSPGQISRDAGNARSARSTRRGAVPTGSGTAARTRPASARAGRARRGGRRCACAQGRTTPGRPASSGTAAAAPGTRRGRRRAAPGARSTGGRTPRARRGAAAARPRGSPRARPRRSRGPRPARRSRRSRRARPRGSSGTASRGRPGARRPRPRGTSRARAARSARRPAGRRRGARGR